MYAMSLFRRVQMLSRAALTSHWSMVGAKDWHSLHLIGRDSWLGIRIYARSRGSLSVNDNSLAKTWHHEVYEIQSRGTVVMRSHFLAFFTGDEYGCLND